MPGWTSLLDILTCAQWHSSEVTGGLCSPWQNGGFLPSQLGWWQPWNAMKLALPPTLGYIQLNMEPVLEARVVHAWEGVPHCCMPPAAPRCHQACNTSAYATHSAWLHDEADPFCSLDWIWARVPAPSSLSPAPLQQVSLFFHKPPVLPLIWWEPVAESFYWRCLYQASFLSCPRNIAVKFCGHEEFQIVSFSQSISVLIFQASWR